MRVKIVPFSYLLLSSFFLTSCNLPSSDQTSTEKKAVKEETVKQDINRPHDTSKVLATVNGQSITDQQYEVFVHTINKNTQVDSISPAQKKQIITEMADRLLLQQYAEKWGLDKDVRIEIALNLQRQLLLALAAKKNILANDIKISDAQLKERYDSEKANAHPTEYHIQHINVATEDEAKDIIAKLEKKADFATLAKEFSLDKSKENGGDLGWVQKTSILPTVFNSLNNLGKGNFTKTPVQTQSGWQIIKLVDTRPVTFLEYSEARSRLLPVMQREQLAKKILSLRNEASIEIMDK